MSRLASRQRVLVVGLDGATFRLLGPWLESGELPCLSNLYQQGMRGELESVVPALSPEAWSTFMTGTHPGQHGVMNFLSFKPHSHELQFNNGAVIRQKTLWRLLSDAGKSVGVIGVPMTYPPEAVNGYLVSGLETPGAQSKFAHPAELCDELRRSLGGYDLHGDFVDHIDPSAYLSRILKMIDNHSRAACYLFDRYPADFSVLVIGATDRVQHYFWRFADPSHPGYEPNVPSDLAEAMKRVYVRIDAALEALLEKLPGPRTVIIMSDHGFGPCHKLVHLNDWLEREGYLSCSASKDVGFTLVRSISTHLCKYAPRWFKDWLKNRLPSVRSQLASFLLLSRVEWSKTKAVSVSTQHSYVYLNRRDRFPQGIVRPGAEADAVGRELAAKLEALRDPDTGEPIVERVCHTRSLYAGPAVETLPDLVVLWREGYVAQTQAMENPGGEVPRPKHPGALIEPTGCSAGTWNASHRPEGILIAHGPELAGPGLIEGARLIDLAPTLLHLVGEPIPQEMAGRVLTDLFKPAFLAANPVRYSSTGAAAEQRVPENSFSAAERHHLAERLRGLGYLD